MSFSGSSRRTLNRNLSVVDEEGRQALQRAFRYRMRGWDAQDIDDPAQEAQALGSDSSDSAEKTGWPAIKHHIYSTLSYPEYSRTAGVVATVSILFILISSVSFCLETLPAYANKQRPFEIIEIICIIVFTTEYLGRLVCAPNRWRFFRSPLAVIDLLAILPFYVQLFVASSADASSTRILRILRLIRVIRVLKVGTRLENLQVVLQAATASLDVLIMLLFLLLLLLVIYSSVLYFVETGDNPDFNSIPAVFWWTHVTLTTTGYGDIIPATWFGKFLAGLCMITSMVIFALPISVIGANFTNLWLDHERHRQMADRAAKAMPNFRELVQSMGAHKQALDDVLDCVKVVQMGVDKNIVLLRQLAQRARLAYLMQTSKAAGGREQLAAGVNELKALRDSMQASMREAKDQLAELSVHMQLADLASSNTLKTSLDKAHLNSKGIASWVESSQFMLDDLKALQAEVDSLKASLGRPVGQLFKDGSGRGGPDGQQLLARAGAPAAGAEQRKEGGGGHIAATATAAPASSPLPTINNV